MKTMLGVLATGLLVSGLTAAPAAGAAGTASYPLAVTQTSAVEVAAFWLGNGGANLADATPYAVQTDIDEVILGGTVVADGKPGTVPPVLPPDGAGDAGKGPVSSGKVFFVGADGLPHWCTGTAMQSQYRNLVATAGHCGYDQQYGAALGKWVFVPGHSAGAAPSGLYVGKQLFTHFDFPAYGDHDRDYAFVTVHNGVTSSPAGELTDTGRLVDQVGGQGLAWNQPLDSSVDVFGFPAGVHPDGSRPQPGDTLETFSGRTSAAQAPGLKAEELAAVDSPFPGEGSLGSSWLLRYDKSSRVGHLNAITISVADTDGDLRYDKSFSPYFDGELRGVYSDASTQWSGSIVLP
ncbi:trypsin-like serine peptidase [Nonomuraea sp. NPDC049684]|uniref:trypsin-like serine peptidase n=1 Tax=Nonomuraea sp. NPDC049684 TaxID=3364356 RepID=UPI0037A355BD